MRTNPRKLAIGLAAGLGVGVVAMWFAISLAEGGHGTYLPAAILFPYAMISAVALTRISLIPMAIGIAQFPAYGAAVLHRKARIIALAHVVGAAAAYLLVTGSEAFR